MKNVVGSPVSGDEFIGREEEKKFALYHLLQGNSVLLLGLRRTGKSSLLKEVNRELKIKKYTVTDLIDCQAMVSPSEFFMAILEQLPESLWEKVLGSNKKKPQNLIKALQVKRFKLDKLEVEFRDALYEYNKPISEALKKIADEHKEKLIIFIDELPYFFENLLEARDKTYSVSDIQNMLALLRSWRNSGISMMICGSIQIDHFLESKKISQKLLADLNRVQLEPYSEETAKGMITLLATSRAIKLSDESIQKMLELIEDRVPFFIQKFFSCLALHGTNYSVAQVEEIYYNRVYPDLDLSFLRQFDERLAAYADTTEAETLLDVVAKEQPISTQDLQRKAKSFNRSTLLRLLQDDFLSEKQGKLEFSLQLVLRWWSVKRGLN